MKLFHKNRFVKPSGFFGGTKSVLLLCVIGVGTVCTSNMALASDVATLRQGTPLDVVKLVPAKLGDAENTDVKKVRAYPMQPPTIPHKIDSYQIDTQANKCMSCHDRERVEESQAPMISVTHYMDRDGNFLAEVSPRRYFCTQCHVTQVGNKPLVDNTFTDMRHVKPRKSGQTQ